MRDTKNDIGIVQLLLIAVMAIFIVRCSADDNSKKSTAPDNAYTVAQAFTLCQLAIKTYSRDPDTAEIPYVENYASKPSEYYFAWGAGTQHIRIRNGLGLDVPVSAACIVDANTKAIVQLSINGQTIK